jgi:hypothetical protein
MPIIEYAGGAAFSGVIGRTAEESSPARPAPVRAGHGAPNVLFIVLDDTGLGSWDASGARSRPRTSTRWPRTGCGTSHGTVATASVRRDEPTAASYQCPVCGSATEIWVGTSPPEVRTSASTIDMPLKRAG